MAKAYFEVLTEAVKHQGTIDRARKRINEAQTGVSHELFLVAQDTAAQDVETFVSLCEQAEAEYKASKGKRAKANIPKQWTQAKSNIKAALNFGLNLKDYSTESAMRKALLEARKASKVTSNAELVVQVYNKLAKTGAASQADQACEELLGTLKTMLEVHSEAKPVNKEDKPRITAAA